MFAPKGSKTPVFIFVSSAIVEIKTGVFDPLGANIESNKDLYFKLINNLSRELKDC